MDEVKPDSLRLIQRALMYGKEGPVAGLGKKL
jgi:hypothetical protein